MIALLRRPRAGDAAVQQSDATLDRAALAFDAECVAGPAYGVGPETEAAALWAALTEEVAR